MPAQPTTAQSTTAQATTAQATTAPTRRLVLATAFAASLGLAGCKGLTALGPLPKVSPDVMTLDHAITGEELMVATYQAATSAVAGHARSTAMVAELLSEHQAHLAQLRSRLVLPRRLAQAKPAPSPKPPTLPSGRRQVIAQLEAAEQAASARLLHQLLAAPPSLAQLMASIAAAEASHVVVLGNGRLP